MTLFFHGSAFIAAFCIIEKYGSIEAFQDALTIGTDIKVNKTRNECIWRKGNDKDPCPDPLIHYSLYTTRETKGKSGGRDGWAIEKVRLGEPGWLRESFHDHSKDTVVLVHGYAGIADSLPMGVLRDAYMMNGSYNVYVVDWGGLAELPCYAAAVYNMRPVGRCLAGFLTFLRDSGVIMSKTTCVGHSLGAHVCGIAANYLQFRMHRIIGVDPARPLIRSQLSMRLDAGDADIVQIIHVSSTFGDSRRAGSVDFCVNGARTQPFCANTINEALCSHVRSVCFLAESLNTEKAREGQPCPKRCLTGERPRNGLQRQPYPALMGQHTPDWAEGVYCVSSKDIPYCPTPENPIGNPLCCVPPRIKV